MSSFNNLGEYVDDPAQELEERIERVRRAQAWAADMAQKWTARSQERLTELARLEAGRDLELYRRPR